MQSQENLQRAFKSTKLSSLGYTLETAMQNKALAICLNRLAQLKPKQPAAREQKQYWYNNI